MKKLLKAALLSLIAAILLSSCGNSTSENKAGNDSQTNDHAESTVEETIDPDMPTLKNDYNGSRFKVIYPTHANFEYQHSDENSGDSVNEALYKRDQYVESLLNTEISYNVTASIEDVYPAVKNTVLSGDNEYELVLNHVNWELTSYISDKLVYDWYKVPNVDLTKPYWNKNMNDSFAIQGVLPIATSKYILADPLMIFINTQLAENNNIEDPYELVKSGKWTWTKLAEMSAAAKSDINGDGTMDDNDQYGFVVNRSTSSYMLRSIPSSANQYIYSRGSDGNIVCTVNTSQMQSLLEQIVDMFSNGGGYLLNLGSKATEADAVSYFSKGTSLFLLVDSLKANSYRSIDFQYGIVPLPKYDEKQEDYYSLDWSGLMMVPITVSDAGYVGNVVEWLSYYGSTVVQPVFFTTLMHEKVARDDNSADMLKLIFDSLVYDSAINYKSPGFYSFFDSLVISGKSDLASLYAKNESKELEYIQSLNDMYSAFK